MSFINRLAKNSFPSYGAKKQIIGLLVFVVLATLPFWLFHLDFWAQDFFYCANQDSRWCYGRQFLWDLLYHRGALPAGILAIASVLVLLFGNLFSFLKNKKIYALFLLLTIVLGPGLIINSFLKMSCGRPRPREVVQYQGNWQYHNVWEKGVTGKGKSFPCGHCSVGFVFVAFYFIFYRKRKFLAYTFLLLGISYGGLIGLARMSQGGHFFSDMLWSGIVVFFSGWLLYHYVLQIPKRELGILQSNALSKKQSAFFYSVLLSMVLGGIILATPVFYEKEFRSPQNLHLPYQFSLECDYCQVKIRISDELPQAIHLKMTAQGFGFPGSKVYPWLNYFLENNLLSYRMQIVSLGFFTELVDSVQVDLSPKLLQAVAIDVKDGDIFIEDPKQLWKQSKLYIRQKKGSLHKEENIKIEKNEFPQGLQFKRLK